MSMAALRWCRRSRGLTPTQTLVLFVLADAADGDGVCWNAASSIAEETGLSDRAVRTALHDLIEAGAIVGTMRSGVRPSWRLVVDESGTTFLPKRNGVPVSKRNHVPTNRKQVPSKAETRSVKAETVSDEPSITPIEPPRTLILTEPVCEPTEHPFEGWWRHYPRKQGKDAARKAYASARKRGASDADLAAGLQRQKWPKDPQFIPMPATWLNGGRWQDDPEAAAPAPPADDGLWWARPDPPPNRADARQPFDLEATPEPWP